MKKSLLAIAAAALAFSSCSSLNQLQTQTYDDGLYVRPLAVVEAQTEVPAGEIDNLLAESKAS